MPYRPALAAVLLTAAFAPAQDRTRPVTPDDYASVAAITEIAVSPDGKQVAYCEARWDVADDGRKTELWVVATDGKGKPRRLTFDRANDRHPRWAADGSAVYALANRKRTAETVAPYDGKTQVWRVPAGGGEPFAVTKVPGGVAGYDLAPKADALFYAVDTTATDDDAFAKLRAKHKAEYGHGTRKVSELYRLDLQTWRAEKVIDEKRYVREFAATQDGKRVAMITADDDSVVRSEGGSRVDVWDVESGKVSLTDDGWRKTAASPWPWLGELAWNPNGDRLAFCTIFDAYPAEIIVAERKDGRWAATRMDRKNEIQVAGYGSPIRWGSAGELAFIGDDKGKTRLAGFMPGRASSGVGEIDASDRVMAWGTYRPDGSKQAFHSMVRGRADGFPELVRVEPAKIITSKTTPEEYQNDPKYNERVTTPITNLNPQATGWQFPAVGHITWKAPDGTEVGGVLELPPGYKKGDRLPLIVAIHGGPTTSTKSDLLFDPHNGRLYLSARGYAVLCPNYRGSTGYGDKFLSDLIGNENDLDVKDIVAGIQHLVAEGIADPERVGVMGWSNGGYLTNCLIALKDPPVKIKAASSGAGIVDTVAEWGFNDEPAYPIVFKKGLPWETPDVYSRTSPTYGLGNVTTPTLIHVGGNDERCPPGHSRMLYRALREYRKVPTELVVYPGEPHGLTKLSNRKAKMEWDIAWFDNYLLGK